MLELALVQSKPGPTSQIPNPKPKIDPAEYKGAVYAVMDASRHLDRLSRSDVSFAGSKLSDSKPYLN